MVFRIIPALVIAAFGLLVFAERLGLPAALAFDVTLLLVVAGGCATTLAATTTRLALYQHQPASLASVLVLALGNTLLACLPPFSVMQNAMDAAAFCAGFALASLLLPQLGLPAYRFARNGVLVASGLIALVLLLACLPSVMIWFASPAILESWQVSLLFIALPGMAVFLGGGAGVQRLAGYVAALLIIMLLLPVMGEALSEQGLHPSLTAGGLAVFKTWRTTPLLDHAAAFGIGLAFAAPLQPILMRVEPRRMRLAVTGGTLLGMGGVAILLLILTFAFRGMLETQLAATAPVFWPPFVFEERIAGWITVCGIQPYDVADVLRACTSQGRGGVPGILLNMQQAAPAFATWRGWPVVFGMLANVLVPGLALCALALHLHHVVACFSETVWHSWLFPHALKSVRLALCRLTVLALVAVLLVFTASGMALPIREIGLSLIFAGSLYAFACFAAFLAYIPAWYQNRLKSQNG